MWQFTFFFGSSLLGNVANIFAQGLVFDSLAVLEPQVAAGTGDAMTEALLSILPIMIRRSGGSGVFGFDRRLQFQLEVLATQGIKIQSYFRLQAHVRASGSGESRQIHCKVFVSWWRDLFSDRPSIRFAETFGSRARPYSLGLYPDHGVFGRVEHIDRHCPIDAPYQVYQHNQKMR